MQAFCFWEIGDEKGEKEREREKSIGEKPGRKRNGQQNKELIKKENVICWKIRK